MKIHTNDLVYRVLRKSKHFKGVLRISRHRNRGKITRRGLEDQSDGEIERGRRADMVLESELVVRDALSGDEAVDGAVERQ